MLRRLLAASLFLAVLASAPAATSAMRAAALVNDEVITMTDLRMRVRLVMLSSDLPRTDEQRRRLMPRVLRSMINEKLRLQEAKKLGLAVSDKKVKQQMQRVAARNDMALGRFKGMLKRNGIAPRIFRAQMRASRAWQQIIRKRIRPRVQIGDDEVEAKVEQLKAKQGQRQLRVREIVLTANSPSAAQRAEQTAQRLIRQVRDGANFGALAQQFSQVPTAAQGGKLGWVTPGALPKAAAERLRGMAAGEIAGPIRTPNGVYIVKLTDTRRINVGTTRVNLKQVRFPTGDRSEDAARKAARTFRDKVDGCDGLAGLAKDTPGAGTVDLGTVKMRNLPQKIADAVGGVKVGATTKPMKIAGDVALLAVCERTTESVNRKRIRRNLLRQRVNLMAQRYMRDLREKASIDVRL